MNKKRVVAFGGLFITSPNPKALTQWYQKHLGIDFGGKIYTSMHWKNNEYKDESYTAFSVFEENSSYLSPSKKPFMINFRVYNLEEMLADLAKEDIFPLAPECEVMESIGKFNWILDPDGNKIELWEQLG